MPLGLQVKVPVELSFSVWDGVDRESVSMGGRMVKAEEEMTVRASFTLYVYSLGMDNELIDLGDGEIEDRYHEVDLGEVDIFEPEDYWNDIDQA
ncbi:hypothetical protein HDIA_0571 [Hartmannibacter diazotrophicus]|uniref:Uncharacterized protein n=2 Tax=Hartmannibacter diazotrophicus TaxID=1482074 RepID=A0A2C9D1C0_9HYPH|nr:hypothetical protein HDIA_0571 [Hartmannibacter diazotrophicus]